MNHAGLPELYKALYFSNISSASSFLPKRVKRKLN